MDNTHYYATLTEALTVFKDDPLEYQPGTKYIYSSEGYTLLAVAVEGASGMNYFDYVRTHIFQPAGMDGARAESVDAIIPHRTQGYKKLPNGDLVNSGLADMSSKAVTCGTAGDLAKFAIAFLSGTLVRPQTVEEMFKVYPVTERQTPGGAMGYGMGWNVVPRQGNKELEAFKAGNQQRVTGLLYIRPERKCVVAILCNLEDAPITARFARQLSDIVLGETKATP
jgi:CubicO group peptidase (beta-lactamase class C family)